MERADVVVEEAAHREAVQRLVRRTADARVVHVSCHHDPQLVLVTAENKEDDQCRGWDPDLVLVVLTVCGGLLSDVGRPPARTRFLCTRCTASPGVAPGWPANPPP